MRSVVVEKLDYAGRLVTSYSAELVSATPTGVLLEAAWTRPPLDLGYVRFEPGDRFLEWFYRENWFNIFQVCGGDGSLKGWYCNVAMPADITSTHVRCRDLFLDLWVDDHSQMMVLDEDEFEMCGDLSTEVRARARAGLRSLQVMVRAEQPPFTPLSSRERSTTSAYEDTAVTCTLERYPPDMRDSRETTADREDVGAQEPVQ